MKTLRTDPSTLKWTHAPAFVLASAAGFHLAYAPVSPILKAAGAVACVACAVELSRLRTRRQAFYVALVTGLLCVVPQAAWFWNIFGPGAIPLWLILAFWIGLFVMLVHLGFQRIGLGWTAAAIPVLWTGLEYFRSELYYLKFSWLNIGYAFAEDREIPFRLLGMYGVGFVIAAGATLFRAFQWTIALPATAALLLPFAFPGRSSANDIPGARSLNVAGVQMEFPLESAIPEALDKLVVTHPEAELLVLSEYTLDGPVPKELKRWCRENRRYLVIGGKDPVPPDNFRDTVFVVGPDGSIVFQQGKSKPIQFFKDGLPAEGQALWNSPWGRIGICVCYDLSYTRVTDRLIRMGAEALIVPTMDVEDWGRYQHALHARVAPVRAAEYGVPVIRVASSGISQITDRSGRVLASAPFPGEGAMLQSPIDLGKRGSLPADRWLAPAATGGTIVFVLALLLCGRNRRLAPLDLESRAVSNKPLAEDAAVQPESRASA
jgi:apolipoprotein N-acyltransferase